METLAPLLFKFPAARQKPSSPPLAAWSRAPRSMPGVAPRQLCLTYPGKAAAPERRWDRHSSTAPLWLLPPRAGCACLLASQGAWSHRLRHTLTHMAHAAASVPTAEVWLWSLVWAWHSGKKSGVSLWPSWKPDSYSYRYPGCLTCSVSSLLGQGLGKKETHLC